MHGPAANHYSLTEAVYASPISFTATYLGANTLTLTGLPFTPSSNNQITEVRVMTVRGATLVYPSASYNMSFNSGTGVLTVLGAAFNSTDTAYRVTIIGEARGFSAATNSYRGSEVAPTNLSAVIEETLVVGTNLGIVALEYPSADGLAMLGYKNFSLNGILLDADATIYVEVYGTNDPNVTAASRRWIALYGFRTDAPGVVNRITCASTTVTFGWDFDNCNYKYLKVLFTPGGTNTYTLELYCRRSY